MDKENVHISSALITSTLSKSLDIEDEITGLQTIAHHRPSPYSRDNGKLASSAQSPISMSRGQAPGSGCSPYDSFCRTPARVSVLFPANDEAFAVFIDDADDAASPTIGGLGDFIGINPILHCRGTILCRTSQTHSPPVVANHFNLPATDEFVAAPAKPSIVERIPLPRRIHFA